jgi:predicted methyltransferase
MEFKKITEQDAKNLLQKMQNDIKQIELNEAEYERIQAELRKQKVDATMEQIKEIVDKIKNAKTNIYDFLEAKVFEILEKILYKI